MHLPDAMKRSSLVEPAVDHAINCGFLTPMRVGGPLLFAAPLVLAIQMQRVVGAVILSFILITTFITHRPRKAWSHGLREDMDLVAITLWYMYNTLVVVEVILDFALHGSAVVRVVLLVLACCGAGGCVVIDRLRCTFTYRSYTRDLLHLLMHGSGAVGTYLLLLAAER